jgi:N-lysine methyltransferase SETD6
MGSRILSRSFHVGADVEEMSVEEEPSSSRSNSEEIEDDEDTDDDDDPGNVAMVPIADMLNARYGCENVCVLRFSLKESLNNIFPQAKLFYEQHHLRMVTTRFIPQGEQIVRVLILSLII